MPSYSFRCVEGCSFDALYGMSEVPRETVCRVCGSPSARRAVTAPHLSKTGTSQFKLMDHSAKSAHEPQVVSSLPTRGPGAPTQRHTSNPLHAKLPRN